MLLWLSESFPALSTLGNEVSHGRATKQTTTTDHSGDIQFSLLLHALVLQQEEVPEESSQSLSTRSRCCCCLRPFGQEDFLDLSHVFVCVCLFFPCVHVSATSVSLSSNHFPAVMLPFWLCVRSTPECGQRCRLPRGRSPPGTASLS